MYIIKVNIDNIINKRIKGVLEKFLIIKILIKNPKKGGIPLIEIIRMINNQIVKKLFKLLVWLIELILNFKKKNIIEELEIIYIIKYHFHLISLLGIIIKIQPIWLIEEKLIIIWVDEKFIPKGVINKHKMDVV